MNDIIDKIVLLISCVIIYLTQDNSGFTIIPIILTIIFGCLFYYYEDYRLKLAGIIVYLLLCLIFPKYIILLPVLLYDIANTKFQFILLLMPILCAINYKHYNILVIALLAVLLAFSYLLKFKTDRLNKMQKEYNELRDSSAEVSLRLKEKTQSLIQNQVYEINLATLNERNRISRELHDSIGHLLSRALLQVGALLTISGDEAVSEGLTMLKESLSGGMDQIRSSIHNMYDDSIDMYQQIQKLVKDFSFCHLDYSYDITTQPSLQLKQSFISIVKEALANIMRHSDATKASIILREHPAIYQLIIQDNGTIKASDQLMKQIESRNFDEGMEGMGLHNIAERVNSFGGILNISIENGFKIFISIPKNKNKH